MTKKNSEVFKAEGIEIVLFDLWRTLCKSEDQEPIWSLQLAVGHQVRPGPGTSWQADPDPEFLRACLTLNIKDEWEFLKAVAAKFGRTPTLAALNKFREILSNESCNLCRYLDVDKTVREIAHRGYRLGVISNLWPFPERQIFGSEFGELFEHRIYSYEVGDAKPGRKIFDVAREKFHVADPSKYLVVGDNPQNDVQAALDAGMKAALVDRLGNCPVKFPPSVPVINSLSELYDYLPARQQADLFQKTEVV